MKNEVSRTRKKYETVIVELEAQIDTLNKNFALSQKENKGLLQRIRVSLEFEIIEILFKYTYFLFRKFFCHFESLIGLID